MQQKRRQRSYSYCLLLEAIPVLWICISEAGVRILWNIVGMLVEPLKIYEFFREVPASNNLEQMYTYRSIRSWSLISSGIRDYSRRVTKNPCNSHLKLMKG